MTRSPGMCPVKPKQIVSYFNAMIHGMHKRVTVVSRCNSCGTTTDVYTWFAPTYPCPECGNRERTARYLAKWRFHKYRRPTRWFRLNRSLDERDGYWEVIDHG